MCKDICPKEAIDIKVDRCGFWYPVVDKQKCDKCAICVRKCPVLNKTRNLSAFPPDVLCAWNKDEEIRIKSTSGGVYYALAKTMLERGGCVAGCACTDDWKSAKHILGYIENDVKKTCQSKYFQSDTEGIYKKVKIKLDQNENVLFSGTPCQNAALREFLGKDYNNLIQCDFVCRGINSPKAYRAYVDELERKYGAPIRCMNFKNKREGWTNLGIWVQFENGKEEFTNRSTSVWWKGYLSENLFMRPSCNSCRFKNIPRISDITFGDFWGLKSSEENMQKGMSLVLINTEKGRRFYGATEKLLNSEPESIEIAKAGNPAMLRSAPANKNREAFFSQLDSIPFEELVRRYAREESSIKKLTVMCLKKIGLYPFVKRIIKGG